MSEQKEIACVTSCISGVTFTFGVKAPSVNFVVGTELLCNLGSLGYERYFLLDTNGLKTADYLNGWDLTIDVLIGLPTVDAVSLKDHNLGSYVLECSFEVSYCVL